MKTLFLFLLTIIMLGTVFQGCRKARENETVISAPNNTYIAFFKKDSITRYLGTSVSADTTGVRAKLDIYMHRILAAHAVTEFKIRRSFYGDVNSCGTIVDLNASKDVASVGADPRLDSLAKSSTFKAF